MEPPGGGSQRNTQLGQNAHGFPDKKTRTFKHKLKKGIWEQNISEQTNDCGLHILPE